MFSATLHGRLLDNTVAADCGSAGHDVPLLNEKKLFWSEN